MNRETLDLDKGKEYLLRVIPLSHMHTFTHTHRNTHTHTHTNEATSSLT